MPDATAKHLEVLADALATPGERPRLLEALARALYETDLGTNGYPPLHTSIPWKEVSDPARRERPSQYKRAEEILRKMGQRDRLEER